MDERMWLVEACWGRNLHPRGACMYRSTWTYWTACSVTTIWVFDGLEVELCAQERKGENATRNRSRHSTFMILKGKLKLELGTTWPRVLVRPQEAARQRGVEKPLL